MYQLKVCQSRSVALRVMLDKKRAFSHNALFVLLDVSAAGQADRAGIKQFSLYVQPKVTIHQKQVAFQGLL